MSDKVLMSPDVEGWVAPETRQFSRRGGNAAEKLAAWTTLVNQMMNMDEVLNQ